jgi:sugar phosphate isomerase/epimerase
MRACLHSVSLPEETVFGVLRKAKAAGYHSLELNAETLPWAKPHVTPKTTQEERLKIRAEASRLDLSIAAIGAHINMIDSDHNMRQQAVEFVKGCIDLACDLRAPFVHVLSGPLAAESSRAEAWSWFAEAVAVATDHAAGQKITLGVEAVAGHLFCLIDDYHSLYKDLPGSNFKVNFDPSHLIVQGEEPKRVVDELGTQIAHVHMKDGTGRFPSFTFPPIGQGNIDFTALVAALREVGYGGDLSFEYEAQVYGFKLTDDEILSSGRTVLTHLGIA